MCSFVSNPILSLDLSFSGAQNTINDVVLRFMSSKMHKIKTQCNYSTNLESKSDTNKLEYVAKLQFKYYKKLLNSLEKGDHGIISALLVDKLLLYFEESDFNINEHYVFGEEDVRQFYIRREILRSIASHTCKDIYQLNMMNFAFFLIVIDDSQEWGRKRISELYVNSKINYEFEDVVFDITDTPSDITNACSISEKFTLPKDYENELSGFFERLKSQYDDYCLIFRDGQDTSNRNFDFVKKYTRGQGYPLELHSLSSRFALGLCYGAGADYKGPQSVGSSWEIMWTISELEKFGYGKHHGYSIGFGIDWRNFRMDGRSKFVKLGDGTIAEESLPSISTPMPASRTAIGMPTDRSIRRFSRRYTSAPSQ